MATQPIHPIHDGSHRREAGGLDGASNFFIFLKISSHRALRMRAVHTARTNDVERVGTSVHNCVAAMQEYPLPSDHITRRRPIARRT
jgi:hypothetical protein